MSADVPQTCMHPLTEHGVAKPAIHEYMNVKANSKMLCAPVHKSPPQCFSVWLKRSCHSAISVSRGGGASEEESDLPCSSRYFLMTKETGEMRLILDLSLFNGCIMKRPFQMLSIRHGLECKRSGDWFTSTNLRDASFIAMAAGLHANAPCLV